MRSLLIVLDTNMFRGDVHAMRRQMRAVLEGAAKGDFSLVLPEVVRQELVKQYPRRMKKVRKEVARAIGAHATELESLGLATPALTDDEAVDAAGYEQQLKALFEGEGCRIAELPDLRPTVTWAVHRRKPFKESGEGLQDAAIWLTVLDLAPEDETVLLASTNIKDFGDGEDPPGLAPDLREDLHERGLPRDRVRLITSLPDLVEQIVQPAAEADARADRLLADHESAARLHSAIERAVLYRPLPQRELRLGVDLDDDPQAIGLDIDEIQMLSARAVEDELLIRARALLDVQISTAVFRADWYIAEGESALTVSGDLNDHYVEAEGDISVWADLEIVTNPLGNAVQVELGDVERLSDAEILQRRLDGDAGQQLVEPLASLLSRPKPVDYYVPPERDIEGPLQEAELTDLEVGSIALSDIDDYDEDGWTVTVVVRGSGDVRWLVTAPSPTDLVEHADLGEGDTAGGGWIADVAQGEPMTLLISGDLARDGSWSGVVLHEAVLSADELARREARTEPQDAVQKDSASSS